MDLNSCSVFPLFCSSSHIVKAGPGQPGPPACEIRSARIPSQQGTRPRCLVSQGSPPILFIQRFQLSDHCPRAIPCQPGLSRAMGCNSAAGMIHQLESSLLWRARDLKAVLKICFLLKFIQKNKPLPGCKTG